MAIQEYSFGKLFLVSVPIGNLLDFTDRAKITLKEVDIILCEEYQIAKQFLKHLSIDKPLIALNEHTEKNEIETIINELKSGKNIAMISDHGTPLIEDPGLKVVQSAIKNNIVITSIPGASSILSALILSGFDTKKFLYYGLLSPKTDERKKELFNLKNIIHTIILLDTPYRMERLLSDVYSVFGKSREVSLSMNLTTESENTIRGSIEYVLNYIKSNKIKKCEFVLVIKGNSQRK